MITMRYYTWAQLTGMAAYDTVKDDLKSFDCLIRAVELGSPEACCCIASRYMDGNGVHFNRERADLFARVDALRGNVTARHAIGFSEYYDLGNHEIGTRHLKIAAEAGEQRSLNKLKDIFNADDKLPGKEFISKEYLESIYRSCHEAQMEVKTEEREKHLPRDDEYM